MAFPYIFESNFETSLSTEWDSEQDTGSLLDVAHVSELARFPWSNAAPFRGAYAMRVKMGDTNDHTVREGDIDIADAATAFTRFYLYLAPDVTATADDSFQIMELQQAGGTVECSMGLRITAATGNIEIGIGDGTAPTDYAVPLLQRNRWYAIEWKVKVSTAGTGTQDLYVDGATMVSLTTLTNAAAVGRADFGTQDTLSTTTGTILFEQFVFDDARIYPFADRYPIQMLLTKSAHVFIGPGTIENVSLLSGAGTDNVLSIYDTNRGNTNDAFKVGVELKNVTNNDIVDPAGMPVQVKRGAFINLTGTNPRALVNFRSVPAYGSAGAVRAVASRLVPNPLEVL